MESNMNKIQRVSRYFVTLFSFLAVALPLFLGIQWVLIDAQTGFLPEAMRALGMLERSVTTPEGAVALKTIPWTMSLKLLGLGADLVGALPLFISFFLLRTLFTHYVDGEIFSPRNAQLYKKLGLLYVMDALLMTPLSQTLLILTATATNAPGHRYVSVSFGTPNLSSLFYGMLVILVSWIMYEASQMKREQDLTV
ncbi:MAG: hypothetical protein C0514_06500 [Candidatus Puniceispirillum sp.]|nr:hypothetical protein [Candidatus Puniceispirillum sp.]